MEKTNQGYTKKEIKDLAIAELKYCNEILAEEINELTKKEIDFYNEAINKLNKIIKGCRDNKNWYMCENGFLRQSATPKSQQKIDLNGLIDDNIGGLNIDRL